MTRTSLFPDMTLYAGVHRPLTVRTPAVHLLYVVVHPHRLA